MGTLVNFCYHAIFDAVLEFSSSSYISARTRGRPAIMVSTHTFSWG